MYGVDGVRALEVGGVPCVDATIRDGSYPFVQDFYAVIRKSEPEGSAARRLYDLVTGAEGASLMAACGYTPILSVPTAAQTADSGTAGPVIPPPDAKAPDADAHTQDAPVPDAKAGVRRAIFPITAGEKTGFIDSSGALTIEPSFDGCDNIYFRHSDSPHSSMSPYYFVYRCATDARGVPDTQTRIYAAVAGPDGVVPLKSDGPVLSVYQIDETGRFYGRAAIGEAGAESTREVIFDANGAELRDDGDGNIGGKDGAQMFLSVPLSDRRVTRDASGRARLSDIDGRYVSDAAFDSWEAYESGKFIFRLNGRFVVADGDARTLREFGAETEIESLSFLKDTGLYVYHATEGDGLMGSDGEPLTGPDYDSIYTDSSGTAIFAAVYADDKEAGLYTVMMLDRNGRRITERDYTSIDETDSLARWLPGGGAGRARYFDAYAGTAGGGGQAYLLDAAGNERMARELGVMSTDGTFGVCSWGQITDDWVTLHILGYDPTAGPGDEAYPERYGLARIVDAPRLIADPRVAAMSPDIVNDGAWLLPPVYKYIYTAGDSRFFIASREPSAAELFGSPDNMLYDVFDAASEKIAFSGYFHELRCVGAGLYDAVTPVLSAPSVFYAENSLYKGYLDERGEWLYRAPRFGTVAEGD